MKLTYEQLIAAPSIFAATLKESGWKWYQLLKFFEDEKTPVVFGRNVVVAWIKAFNPTESNLETCKEAMSYELAYYRHKQCIVRWVGDLRVEIVHKNTNDARFRRLLACVFHNIDYAMGECILDALIEEARTTPVKVVFDSEGKFAYIE